MPQTVSVFFFSFNVPLFKEAKIRSSNYIKDNLTLSLGRPRETKHPIYEDIMGSIINALLNVLNKLCTGTLDIASEIIY